MEQGGSTDGVCEMGGREVYSGNTQNDFLIKIPNERIITMGQLEMRSWWS